MTLALKADRTGFATRITSMDYRARKLTTQDPLPENPSVSIGNDGRQSYSGAHKGKGTRSRRRTTCWSARGRSRN